MGNIALARPARVFEPKGLTCKMCKVYSFHTMYAKVFSRITESSLMEEEIPVRYTFVMLLAISDPTGLVVGTDVALARRLNMPLEQFQKCIAALESEDPDSNSKEEAGRRIIPSIGERGYQIVNFLKYRNMKDEEARRQYMRDYMRFYRSKDPVNSCKEDLTVLGQAEANANADAEDRSVASLPKPKAFKKPTLEEVKLGCAKAGLPDSEAERFWNHYESNGWRVGKNPMRSWPSALANWKVNFETRRYENNAGTRSRSVDRNAGTANAGKSAQYAGIGKSV
jgi:hypothetical protein